MCSELQLDVRCLSCCGGDIWWTIMKERQAWCYLQVKLCDPCLSDLSVPHWPKKCYINTLPFLSFQCCQQFAMVVLSRHLWCDTKHYCFISHRSTATFLTAQLLSSADISNVSQRLTKHSWVSFIHLHVSPASAHKIASSFLSLDFCCYQQVYDIL